MKYKSAARVSVSACEDHCHAEKASCTKKLASPNEDHQRPEHKDGFSWLQALIIKHLF